MGYRKVPVIYTLRFEGEYEGLVVRLKSVKIGEMRRMLRLIDTDEDKTTEVIDNMVALISKALVSWSLETEDGQPIEPTMEEVDDLDFDLVKTILDKWLDQVSGPSEELGKGSGSGVTSPVPLPTMELL